MPPKLNKDKQPLNWTRLMDDYLVDAFMEQYKCGNKVNGTFTSTAYDNIVKEMTALLATDIDKEKIKNRWKTLKRNFSEIYDIFKNGLSGFAWNPSTQLWEAEDQVWDQLIESKPKAELWRNAPFPNYDKMLILYGSDRASGALSGTIGEMKKRNHTINETDFPGVTHGIDIETTQQNVPVDHFEALDTSVNQENSPDATSGSSRKKQKVTSNKEKDSEIIVIKSMMEELAAAIRDGNDAIRESTRKLPQMSGGEVWNMIKESGFSPPNVTKMYRILMRDVDQLKTFVECPMEARQDLLMEIMKDFEST